MIDRESQQGLAAESHRLAVAILEYLARHPNAKDTVEGIARFWLKGDFTEDAVEELLIELVDRGLVRRTLKPDGGWIYGRPRDRGEDR